MVVTVALMGIVPPTVDPDVGDVIVTTRLPPTCAEARGGESRARPRVTIRAAAHAVSRNGCVLPIVVSLSLAGSTGRSDERTESPGAAKWIRWSDALRYCVMKNGGRYTPCRACRTSG